MTTTPHHHSLAAISPDRAGALGLLSEMIKIDTRTQSTGESVLARMLVERMRAHGLESELQEVSPGRFNAIGRLRGSGGGKSLMFNGHLDTNPPTEGWTVDPWGGLVDDEFIYGLGVSNMKAGCASYLVAVEELLRSTTRLRGDIILTFVVGELQGGIGTLRAIESGLRADYFINCEPTDLAAMTLHAGSLKFTVELTGVTRHMSKREEAIDAITAACSLIPAINTMTFGGASTTAYESVNRAHVGAIRGGLGRETVDSRPPQVADVVTLLGAARYAPSQDVTSVLNDIRTVAADVCRAYPGLEAVVTESRNTTGFPDFPPFETDPASPVVLAVNGAFATVRREPQRTGAVRPYCFYGTDAAHLQHRADMQGVVCGPGGRYNTMPDERVDIADYLDAIRIHLHTMQQLCG
ncbi:M20 family metallopeptidase [Streptomyces sp. NPDC059850]|uniref:M20 family metallopeptidase n=1 Tax=Streptomyces sp. NPDC059850 TaxID=3346970 RepID=UPI00364E4241